MNMKQELRNKDYHIFRIKHQSKEYGYNWHVNHVRVVREKLTNPVFEYITGHTIDEIRNHHMSFMYPNGIATMNEDGTYHAQQCNTECLNSMCYEFLSYYWEYTVYNHDSFMVNDSGVTLYVHKSDTKLYEMTMDILATNRIPYKIYKSTYIHYLNNYKSGEIYDEYSLKMLKKF